MCAQGVWPQLVVCNREDKRLCLLRLHIFSLPLGWWWQTSFLLYSLGITTVRGWPFLLQNHAYFRLHKSQAGLLLVVCLTCFEIRFWNIYIFMMIVCFPTGLTHRRMAYVMCCNLLAPIPVVRKRGLPRTRHLCWALGRVQAFGEGINILFLNLIDGEESLPI